MIEWLKKIDRWLLPRTDEFQYGPYLWLVYLLMFFIALVAYHPIKYSYGYATIGTLLFLVAYFHGHWVGKRHIHWHILAILVIGSFMAILTTGAAVFFVFAAAFCFKLGNRRAFVGLLGILLWVIVLSVWWGHNVFFYAPALFFSIMVGGINIYQHDLSLKRKELALSQQEVRHLAQVSERERIARDLHDVIGHSFSVITLKAELAQKLMHKNADKATQEIKAVEDISRQALKQIREVISGYRASDLQAELAHAKYLLESNDIHFHYDNQIEHLPESINKALAIMLKELITNVLKHADADQVKVVIAEDTQSNAVSLQINDNGRGFGHEENQGFGLQGIRERVAELSGQFSVADKEGAQLSIVVPLQGEV